MHASCYIRLGNSCYPPTLPPPPTMDPLSPLTALNRSRSVLLRGHRVRPEDPADGGADLHRAVLGLAGGRGVHVCVPEPARLRAPPASPGPRGLVALPTGEPSLAIYLLGQGMDWAHPEMDVLYCTEVEIWHAPLRTHRHPCLNNNVSTMFPTLLAVYRLDPRKRLPYTGLRDNLPEQFPGPPHQGGGHGE